MSKNKIKISKYENLNLLKLSNKIFYAEVLGQLKTLYCPSRMLFNRRGKSWEGTKHRSDIR